MSLRVLVVDWDPDARAQTVAAVRARLPVAEVIEAGGAVDAEAHLLTGPPLHLALVEYQLPDGYGLRVADALVAAGAHAVVVSDRPGLSPAAAERVVRRSEVQALLPAWLNEALDARLRAKGSRGAGRRPLPARLASFVFGAQ